MRVRHYAADDDACRHPPTLDLRCHVEPCEFRHLDVGEKNVRRLTVDERERFAAVRGDAYNLDIALDAE